MAMSGTPSKPSASTPRSADTSPEPEAGARTLGIDIGGSQGLGAQWTRRVETAIADMRRLTNFDHLYVGGGNAKRLTVRFEPSPDITLVDNQAGIGGGAHAWHD
jgi:hypothetical protein